MSKKVAFVSVRSFRSTSLALSWVPILPDLSSPPPSLTYNTSVLAIQLIEREATVRQTREALQKASEKVFQEQFSLDMAKKHVERCEKSIAHAKNLEHSSRLASEKAEFELEKLNKTLNDALYMEALVEGKEPPVAGCPFEQFHEFSFFDFVLEILNSVFPLIFKISLSFLFPFFLICKKLEKNLIEEIKTVPESLEKDHFQEYYD